MNDQEYMRLALQLARSTRGQTSPNPMVGAVIVKDGTVVGVGAHLRAGDAHAEVEALQMAGDNARGGTMYVTLEPCSHVGKTPPCAHAIIENELKRVVVATTDPNPHVSGRGIALLQEAGIHVEVGLCEQEAIALNEVFFHYIKNERPFVTLKSATTLDGKIATVTGESQWITGKEARKDVHIYRHTHDAILVGIGTVLADNPSLTTRRRHGGLHPVRIILDRTLRTPLDATIVQDGLAPTWIVTKMDACENKRRELEQRGVRVIRLETYSIQSMLQTIGEKGITSLFVEGGAEVNGSFLKEKAIDQLVLYMAPKLFGGKDAPTAIGGTGIEAIDEAMHVYVQEVTMVGKDIKIVAQVKGE